MNIQLWNSRVFLSCCYSLPNCDFQETRTFDPLSECELFYLKTNLKNKEMNTSNHENCMAARMATAILM